MGNPGPGIAVPILLAIIGTPMGIFTIMAITDPWSVEGALVVLMPLAFVLGLITPTLVREVRTWKW